MNLCEAYTQTAIIPSPQIPLRTLSPPPNNIKMKPHVHDVIHTVQHKKLTELNSTKTRN